MIYLRSPMLSKPCHCCESSQIHQLFEQKKVLSKEERIAAPIYGTVCNGIVYFHTISTK